MRETAEDLAGLQEVLDESDASGGDHLRGIITSERRVSAEQLAERLTGMRLLVVGTSTRDGRPRVSPVDGIFYRARFWFGSAPSALKMRHISERPSVSATHIDGEAFAVTVHGTAVIEGTVDDLKGSDFGEVACEIYGDGWLTWGSGAVYAALTPERIFTFSMQ